MSDPGENRSAYPTPSNSCHISKVHLLTALIVGEPHVDPPRIRTRTRARIKIIFKIKTASKGLITARRHPEKDPRVAIFPPVKASKVKGWSRCQATYGQVTEPIGTEVRMALRRNNIYPFETSMQRKHETSLSEVRFSRLDICSHVAVSHRLRRASHHTPDDDRASSLNNQSAGCTTLHLPVTPCLWAAANSALLG